MPYPPFPELSRAPDVSIKKTRDNPGIADKMENGAVATRPRYRRIRKTLKVNYGLLTYDDALAFDYFVASVGTWSAFYWIDNRDPLNPIEMIVRFTKLPEDTDDKFAGGKKRIKTEFEITEI